MRGMTDGWHRLPAWVAQALEQFRQLEFRQAFLWPLLPRVALLVATGVLVAGSLWLLVLSDTEQQLRNAQGLELKLRQEFTLKLTKAVNLEARARQRVQMQHELAAFEKQLPGKEGMDTLISAIHQFGMHRHLQFELFRPGPELVKSFYAEQPIALRVKGSFHDMAGLMADMAHFPHLVTLGNLNLVPGQDGLLTLEATARTYRHLEAAELAQQQNKAVARKVTQ